MADKDAKKAEEEELVDYGESESETSQLIILARKETEISHLKEAAERMELLHATLVSRNKDLEATILQSAQQHAASTIVTCVTTGGGMLTRCTVHSLRLWSGLPHLWHRSSTPSTTGTGHWPLVWPWYPHRLHCDVSLSLPLRVTGVGASALARLRSSCHLRCAYSFR